VLKVLFPNTVGEENGAYTGALSSFDSDGFSAGGDDGINGSGGAYNSWSWKAGGTATTGHTQGSISNTLSANSDAGFSIMTYTGNATAGSTLAHGLSKKPEMIIIKEKSHTGEDWMIYHTGLHPTSPESYEIRFSTSAYSSDVFFQAPTSQYVKLTHRGGVNTSGRTYVAYSFHSVEGHSKVFSHVGNGSSDGTFVYLGFKPAYALFRSYDNADAWYIFDRELDEYNVMTTRFRADNSYGTDTSGGNSLDFVSNGIKFRHADINGNGKKYIGIAFAEHPFKYTTAR
jgi:hypothetical protein